MWQNSASERAASSEKDVKKIERNQEDSGIVDSGFLSDNILASNESSDDIDASIEFKDKKTVNIVENFELSMRGDSGLDLGLSESLNQLSIEHITLDKSRRERTKAPAEKVQDEPTLVPIVVKIDNINQEKENNNEGIEPWQLYYIQDNDGDTQLHIAIIQGFLEAAAFSLIKIAPHPCLLDILNDDGQAALHLAVLTRQPRIVRRLILGGADPSLRDSRGNTALHLACAGGDLTAARALTDTVAPIERNLLGLNRRVPALPQNLEQLNYQGETCLHIAAARDHVDLVRLLLRLGADLEAREGLSGKTALHLAIEFGCHSVTSFLLKECRPCLNSPTYAGLTAYQVAICLDTQLARDLVKLGATPLPLPESDSEISEDSGDEDDMFVPEITRLRQQIGVRV